MAALAATNLTGTPVASYSSDFAKLVLEVAQMAGHTTTQMIIQNYGKYIKGEHLKIDKSLKLFTDKSTDSIA